MPLAFLLAALLSQHGEVVVKAEMVEATPVLTTRAQSGGWTRIAVIGPAGCIIGSGEVPAERGT